MVEMHHSRAPRILVDGMTTSEMLATDLRRMKSGEYRPLPFFVSGNLRVGYEVLRRLGLKQTSDLHPVATETVGAGINVSIGAALAIGTSILSMLLL